MSKLYPISPENWAKISHGFQRAPLSDADREKVRAAAELAATGHDFKEMAPAMQPRRDDIPIVERASDGQDPATNHLRVSSSQDGSALLVSHHLAVFLGRRRIRSSRAFVAMLRCAPEALMLEYALSVHGLRSFTASVLLALRPLLDRGALVRSGPVDVSYGAMPPPMAPRRFAK